MIHSYIQGLGGSNLQVVMAGFPKTKCPHPQLGLFFQISCDHVLSCKEIQHQIFSLVVPRNVIIYLRRSVGSEINSNIIHHVDIASGLNPRQFCRHPILLKMSALASKSVE